MKKKNLISTIVCVLGLLATACNMASHATSTSSAATAQDSNPRKDASADHQNKSVLIWSVDGKGAQLEARLEPLGADSSSRFASPVQLTITNLTTGRVIFSENNGDRPISMYIRDLNDDWREELVVNWAGGSASRLEIIALSGTEARIILNESYRIDAALIDLSGASRIDVLITTGDSGVGPFYTTRYIWKGERYLPVGKVPYISLTQAIEERFRSFSSRRR
jgi:hypothetical protein